MNRIDYVASYKEHFAKLNQTIAGDTALRQAVGGEFQAMGQLEFFLIKQYVDVLQPCTVVDVGCGSGRLSVQLAPFQTVSYVGTDIVPEFLEYAKRLSNRKDWIFRESPSIAIPCESGSVDVVCFFSVFTHLYMHDTYRYLAEAKRVLKKGGKIIFTFLEFKIGCQWAVFEAMLANTSNVHLDQFISRDAIATWASKLGLDVVAINDGDVPHIPLDFPITYEDGRVQTDLGNFGQSDCILSVP
jgi:SAM-dependent methyltransferase